jgi:hypothetical protein
LACHDHVHHFHCNACDKQRSNDAVTFERPPSEDDGRALFGNAGHKSMSATRVAMVHAREASAVWPGAIATRRERGIQSGKGLESSLDILR